MECRPPGSASAFGARARLAGPSTVGLRDQTSNTTPMAPTVTAPITIKPTWTGSARTAQVAAERELEGNGHDLLLRETGRDGAAIG